VSAPGIEPIRRENQFDGSHCAPVSTGPERAGAGWRGSQRHRFGSAPRFWLNHGSGRVVDYDVQPAAPALKDGADDLARRLAAAEVGCDRKCIVARLRCDGRERVDATADERDP
jgi:hypothetical protein